MTLLRGPNDAGRRRPSRNQGQALVEFALVIPIVLLVFLGFIDLGRAVFAYTTIANAAREGARVAIVDQSSVSGVMRAQTEAAGSATSLGIAPAAVTVTFRSPDLASACAARDLGCLAEVTVPYQFTPVTPVISVITGPIAMAATTRIPIERTYP